MKKEKEWKGKVDVVLHSHTHSCSCSASLLGKRKIVLFGVYTHSSGVLQRAQEQLDVKFACVNKTDIQSENAL